ncbi:restriction endonuclease subunit S [Pseudomonas matsuisoli]|uniref:Type I restriction-modification system restriction endonuclease DNA specificity subunit HsdS n=1 Tax=Pseudomonas matsuisoli TaxID=1515666 RepID=A0A917Q0J6_9PSED|nr:restriction endonuclease subunit S [Pseudomonas matsuisoli]GGK02601.1 type I restriction-modification system restriction endonuclease DNA specificity subunit HsdS [Pseudomonas matsuisoli]
MSGLPEGWAFARLDELADINPKQSFADDLDAGFVPMSHAPTNFLDKLRFDSRPWGDIKKAYTNFQDGDVIFAKVTPCFENGKAAFVDGLPNRIGAGSSEFYVLRPATEDISAKYLLAVIKSRDFLLQGAANMTGAVGLRRVPKQFVQNYTVPVPPAAEQTRIAEKLDALLAQVDTLKTRIDSIPALLKRFRQSVLVAAVSGRLTEEWRAENTGINPTEQIETILKDRLSSSKSKKAPASHLKNEEYEIPSTWCWVSLDSLAAKIVDGTHHTPTYVGNGVPFISVKDIRDGVIDFTNTKFITTEEHAELCKRCHPEKGDLLITKSGTIGRTAIIATNNEFSLFVSVALIKPASNLVNMEFINIALRKWIGEIDVSSRIVGSAIKNLHLTDMKVLAIPFAPLTEQTEIVRRVEQLFAFADQLEAKVAAVKTRIDHLTQSILAKAFRGELVPQDPNDEPASVLLERIKAQCAAAPKAKRSRKTNGDL